jgi:aryl-alcohol dehydrogenase-like predicted oxidoreductase
MSGYFQDEKSKAVIRQPSSWDIRISTRPRCTGAATPAADRAGDQGFQPPGAFLISTKVWEEHLHYQDVLKACAGLERLGTDTIDWYLVHLPNPAIPLEETFQALN